MDLYLLLLLACPVVMGVMMWMMMRPSGSRFDSQDREEITQLRSEVDELRAQQPEGNERHTDHAQR